MAKLREKRTSIAAVRGKLGQFDAFLTPQFSHCRLPLSGKKKRQKNLADLTPPRGAENSCQKSWPAVE